MTDTQEWRQDRVSEPQYWYNQAANLRAAAGALHYCSDDSRDEAVADHLGFGRGFRMSAATWQPYLLLCGLSLELLLKATIVASGKQPKETHELKRLANDAGVQFTEEQQGALAILTNCTIWFGKYPAPSQKQHGGETP